ncbi:XdhC family protein [Blautia obeum]|uniref:XdhC family protein n=1 Tax=Blautia obeum TaxID=40520 RepID=UPI0035627F79
MTEKRGESMNLFELYKIINENLQQKSNLLATVLEGEVAGTRYFWVDGELLGYTGTGEVNEELKTQITETPQSGIYEIEGQKFFIEHLKRQAHLVICGGGHVSQQVIKLAGKVGFHVTVLEDRPYFADRAREAGADLVLCDAFEKSLQGIAGTPDTYFLVVTRGHRFDRACLEQILKKPYAYVGMMASRGRSALLKKQMAGDGFDRKALDEMHTPVGLSIYAETPEEIAVSIVAELIQIKNQTKKTAGYDSLLMEYLTGVKEPGQPKVLATIIARRGSAPRSIGTKMLVLGDGRIIGTIGGGCMESEVQHQCLRLLREENEKSRIVCADMTVSQAEDEGMVCGGTIDVFLEKFE